MSIKYIWSLKGKFLLLPQYFSHFQSFIRIWTLDARAISMSLGFHCNFTGEKESLINCVKLWLHYMNLDNTAWKADWSRLKWGRLCISGCPRLVGMVAAKEVNLWAIEDSRPFSFHFFFFNLIYSSLTLCRLMWLELYLELLCNFTFKHYTYLWNHLEISHTKKFYISYRPVQLAFLRYLEYFKTRFGIRLCFGSLNLTHRSPTGCNQFNVTNTALITLAAITQCKLPAGISHILFYT